MRPRFVVPLLFGLAALVPSAAAGVPCPPLQCGPTAATVAGGRSLLAGSGAGRAAVLYDLSTGKARATIPGAVASADGTRAAGLEAHVLRTYDLATGRIVSRKTLVPGWTLAGLSADGRRVVLVRWNGSSTSFSVGEQQLRLPGHFDFDGLLGSRLYLIQSAENGYLVRVADLATRKLDPAPLKDADEPALIQGQAWSRLASPDGRYVFTLYLDENGEAMVHQLDMRAGTAACIDLPGRGDYLGAGSYALALSRDGKRLYAPNGARGVVVTIDVLSETVVDTGRVSSTRLTQPALASASVTPDEKHLAFAVNGTAWIYDLAAKRLVRSWPLASDSLVAYSRAGKLWTLDRQGVLQAAS